MKAMNEYDSVILGMLKMTVTVEMKDMRRTTRWEANVLYSIAVLSLFVELVKNCLKLQR